ncbi:DUF6611 family protein [Mycobacterium sp. C3-094]
MLTAGVRRVLDGDAAWGSLTIQPDRFGTRYLLVVYPPGTTCAERRRIRIWRGWPLWGASLWVLSEFVLALHLDPWLALTASTGLLVVCAGAAYSGAGAARARVRVLAATLLPRRYDPVSADMCEAMQYLAKILRDAASRRATGQITGEQFEMTWWTVYDAMAWIRADSASRQLS